MLIKITQSCSMGCKHCMNNAMPCDKHMSGKVFVDTLAFIKSFSFPVPIVISGGEPTEHPDFMQLMYELFSSFKGRANLIFLTTNGMYFSKHPELLQHLLDKAEANSLSFNVQITKDARYYPKEVDTSHPVFSHKNVMVDCVPQIYPIGRAVTNKLDCIAKTTKCYNIRTLIKEHGLESAIVFYTMLGRTCAPAINYDGRVSAGESDLCEMPATIYDSKDNIVKALLESKCTRCHEQVRKSGGVILYV